MKIPFLLKLKDETGKTMIVNANKIMSISTEERSCVEYTCIYMRANTFHCQETPEEIYDMWKKQINQQD